VTKQKNFSPFLVPLQNLIAHPLFIMQKIHLSSPLVGLDGKRYNAGDMLQESLYEEK
jgi:hypothetical protein